MNHCRIIKLLSAACFLAALSACGDKLEALDEGTVLWNKLKDDYKNDAAWHKAPGYCAATQRGLSPQLSTTSPHDGSPPGTTDIWIDDNAHDVILAGGMTAAGATVTEWPEGSTIVKEGYSGSSTKPRIFAVMQKRRTEGVLKWFWVELDSDEKVEFVGEPSVCTGCHGAAGNTDMVRIFGFTDTPCL